MPKPSECRGPEDVVVESKAGYLSSLISRDTSCGHAKSPWVLTSQPGQRIELSLVDFSWENSSMSADNSESQNCVQNYGYILDSESDDFVYICGGTVRKRQLYLSESHTIQVVLDPQALQKYNFLLQYQGGYYIFYLFDIF